MGDGSKEPDQNRKMVHSNSPGHQTICYTPSSICWWSLFNNFV